MSHKVDERLVGFLYILMRDELPVGKISRIINEHCQHEPDAQVSYSHEGLEHVARQMAGMLSSEWKEPGR